MGRNHSALTIIELLACVAIFAILTTLAIAGYDRAIQSSRAAQATAGLRELGRGFLSYAADNDGQLPQSSHQGPKYAWGTILKRTIPARLFHCPLDEADRVSSYAINDYLTPSPFGAEDLNFSRLQNIPMPSQTMLLGILHRSQENSDHFHFASEGYRPSSFAAEVWVQLIDDAASLYLYVDGHVARLSWADLQIELADPHTRFVRPDGDNSYQEK